MMTKSMDHSLKMRYVEDDSVFMEKQTYLVGDTNQIGYQQVVLRTFEAFTSLAVQFFVMTLGLMQFQLVLKIGPHGWKMQEMSMFSPITWWTLFIWVISSRGFAGVLIATGFFTILFGLKTTCAKSYPVSKIQSFKRFLDMANIVMVVVFCASCALLLRSCGSLLDLSFGNLTNACWPRDVHDDLKQLTSENMCINERGVFTVIVGSVMGTLWLSDYINNQKFVLHFPVLKLTPLELLRYNAGRAFVEAVSYVFRKIVGVIIISCLIGYLLHSSLEDSFIDYHYMGSKREFTVHLWSCLNFALVVNTLLYPAVMMMWIIYTHYVVESHFTQRLNLPLKSPLDEPERISIRDAMASPNVYMKYLGYLDFKALSSGKSPNFPDLFSLSHPAGNPSNWSEIFDQCMDLITNMEVSLNAYISSNEGRIRKDIHPAIQRGMAAYVLTERLHTDEMLNGNLRFRGSKMDTRDLYIESNKPVVVVSPTQLFFSKPIIVLQYSKQCMHGILTRVINYFKMLRIWTSLTKANPRMEVANLLAHSNLVMWAIESIVSAGMGSMTFPSKGAVHKDIAKIAASLVRLYEAVTRLKAIISLEPSTGGVSLNKKTHMSLIRCLKFNSSVFLITFQEHMDNLGVSADLVKKLENYVSPPNEDFNVF